MRALCRPRIHGKILSGLAGLALLFFSSVSAAAPKVSEALVARAEAAGSLRVLVELHLRVESEPALHSAAGPRGVAIQHARIDQAQVAVAAEAQVPDERIFVRYRTLPFMAMEVDARQLAVLNRSWRVRRVVADELLVAPESADRLSPSATDGIRSIKPIRPQTEGWHVAVLDLGNAPDARPAATGPEVLMLPIYSRAEGEACGSAPSPCIQSWRSDQIAALERIYELRTSFDIASVEMGLRSASGCPTKDAAILAAIEQLRGVGIPTLSAADDEAYATTTDAGAEGVVEVEVEPALGAS